eukprot:CAMPEP_0171105418 /NCGR_PEP_ID=MMETSP0766_2-20121228/62648_1 /TAXON_ID=439317 /ORGANISM="Gambierdiscus australes, Strain CAWD 149" /LENGTH=58 /DNA_ID=CAMNT_0011566265 /DNA_START=41 /DNA_END=214 /DNA_ORIENTATION=-
MFACLGFNCTPGLCRDASAPRGLQQQHAKLTDVLDRGACFVSGPHAPTPTPLCKNGLL